MSENKIPNKKIAITISQDIYDLLLEEAFENGIKPSTRITQLITVHFREKIRTKNLNQTMDLNTGNNNNNIEIEDIKKGLNY